MNLKAVFWDIDGVVVLSEPLHVEKINGTAARHGVTVTEQDWRGWHGIGDHCIYEALKDKGLRIPEDQFLTECADYYLANAATLQIRPGFTETFNHFASAGISQAAVSSGVHRQVVANLARANVSNRLLFAVSADDIVSKGLRTKPSGDPYTEALRLLNRHRQHLNAPPVSPDECLGIEDSGSGWKSVVNAGMTPVYWRLSTAQTDEASAGFTLPENGDALVNLARRLAPRQAAPEYGL